MLAIKAIMNSAVEDILAFKTCCGVRAADQNLELHVCNQSDTPVVVPSHLDLILDSGPFRVANLMPNGDQTIMPWDTIAFYCFMDEERWAKARRLVFYDDQGRGFSLDLARQLEKNG